MHWLQTLDTKLFHFINSSLSNPLFDWLMPIMSGGNGAMRWFVLFVIVVFAAVLRYGNVRVRLCALMIVLVVALGDPLVVNTVKHAVARPRPCIALPGVVERLGCSKSGSMPSAHAANWFAATMVMFLYYRRSLRFMLPLAVIVGFSRIYCGVHFPSDVLAGAILGAGYAVAGVWALNSFWRWIGGNSFPLWWQKMPSLTQPERRESSLEIPTSSATDGHYLRLGYLFIAFIFLLRLAYISSGTIELSEDESYYWLWSKHPALSYFSKPPLIAYTQLFGTTLFGDTALGVRFFSPFIAAVLSLILLRFFARNGRMRPGFWLILILTVTPMSAGGSILMTIDPLSVLFWTAAMLAGWRAIQENSETHDWLWVGLWMGLGFLSKYTALFQLVCWIVFFALWPPARKQLRRPGPWLAVLITLLCTLPVLIWNTQHGWVTVSHVAGNAQIDRPWNPSVFRFLCEELILLHPIFFVAAAWTAIAFWRRQRNDPLKVYFFSMGASLFLFYLLYAFHSRVLPNWIAPAIVPLFCLMALYWDDKIKSGAAWAKSWCAAGLIIGAVAVTLLHNTDLVTKIFKFQLPVRSDPLQRVRGWNETAQIVGRARQNLLAEGKPVFIIGNHYGTASEITFYLAEARENVPEHPLVYCRTSEKPINQFYFWPGYKNRKGENAIFATGVNNKSGPVPPPEELLAEFKSVTSLGMYDVSYRNRTIRKIQLFACRDLK